MMPNKKNKCVQVKGLKILGSVGTHIFFNYLFLEKNTILCILKGEMPFKMHRTAFLFRKLKQNFWI